MREPWEGREIRYYSKDHWLEELFMTLRAGAPGWFSLGWERYEW